MPTEVNQGSSDGAIHVKPREAPVWAAELAGFSQGRPRTYAYETGLVETVKQTLELSFYVLERSSPRLQNAG